MSTPSRNIRPRTGLRLDAIDLRILEELQRDARLTNVELAQRVHLSPSPCLARVRALEDSGIIDRYVAIAAPRALGLALSAFIHVRLDRQVEKALEGFEQTISAWPEVLECYLTTGDEDYVLRIVVTDVERLQQLIVNELARIPGVANIRSSLTLKQVKCETALPLGPLQAAHRVHGAARPVSMA